MAGLNENHKRKILSTTPITAVPIHIIAGDKPQLKVSFPESIKDLPVERLPEFATEQGNPANSKRVVAIEVAVPAKRLQEGVAFVDTPGIASLATSGTKLSYAYLPDSDLGVVLVDGHSSLGRDDLDLLRSLHAAGIPSIVLISKCDLLPQDDIEKVVSYTRSAVAEHLGASPEVIGRMGYKGQLRTTIGLELLRLTNRNPGSISRTLDAIRTQRIPLDDPIRVRRTLIDGRIPRDASIEDWKDNHSWNILRHTPGMSRASLVCRKLTVDSHRNLVLSTEG